MKKVHNYSAGPCILPPEVLEQAAEAVREFAGMGLSILEISHRSKQFESVMDEARQLVKELLGVPDNYSAVFIQGGATLGFTVAPMNFLTVGGTAAYVNTGTWATGALKEGIRLGTSLEIASSEISNFNHIPKGYIIPAHADYLHITSNNTIYGTQFQSFPSSPVKVICDMSSDIFARQINVSDFALIYAGAQKNMGPAGATLYIVNNDLLGKSGRNIPVYLDLAQHIKKDSMYNTPPVYSVYVSMLTLRWLKALGGVPVMEKMNAEKARTLYSEIDANPLFRGHSVPEDRSVMNVTFTLTDESLADEFDALWKEAGISGIKGHRSVGGYRASMYNALPLASVKVLTEVMHELALKKA